MVLDDEQVAAAHISGRNLSRMRYQRILDARPPASGASQTSSAATKTTTSRACRAGGCISDARTDRMSMLIHL
jgi:hypothetical protein